MAFNMKLQVVSVLIVAFMFALYSANGVFCQEGGPSTVEKKETATNKLPQGGLPVLVVRQNNAGQGGSENKPDLWLGWTNWNGLSSFRPYFSQFVQPIQPYTQEMSGMVMNNIPGAASIYSQFDQMGNQLSQYNPFSILMNSMNGGSSSAGGSGGRFGNLFEGHRRRR